MSVLTSEAVVLRTWPVHEADLIVSFFTRDYGKVKGVAKSALRSRKRFGGALEPMTVARAWFAERPAAGAGAAGSAGDRAFAALGSGGSRAHGGAEFFCRGAGRGAARTRSPGDGLPAAALGAGADHGGAAVDAADLFFAVDDAADGAVCRTLLIARPAARRCTAGETSFNTLGDGLFCALHRNGNASGLSADSWQLAQRMLRVPASAFAAEPWPRRRGQDLRRFTLQALERHLERKLRSAEALGRLGG